MRAIVQDRYGSADVLRLEEIERPAPGAGEVLVRVRAAGVDRGVWHVMAGLPLMIRVMGFGLRGPKQRVPGNDLAGEVEAVGAGVTRWKPGDEVFGVSAGTFAEYVCARQDKLARKPAGVSFEQAAAVPTSALTALQGLRDHGEVRAGQSVLILGASGGVGTFAVQLARAFDARVTGVCSTSKVDLVRALGADRVLDYTRDDLAASGERHDVILDIGGNRPLSALRRLLAPDGTLVVIGGESGGRWLGGTDRLLRALLLSPFVRQRLRTFIAKVTAEDLQTLADHLEAGRLAPAIERTWPLAEARDAIWHIARGRARGKLVLAV